MRNNTSSETTSFKKKALISTGIFLGVLSFSTFVLAATPVATTKTVTAPVSQPAPSFQFDQLPDMVNYHDFVVGPGKIELQIAPGSSQTVDLTVANRLGSDKVFSITEEDFIGSNDPNQSVVLLGSDRGPYSLKDDIHIPSTKVTIPFGKKVHIPITVSVPTDAQPGGLYGSVLVSVVSVNGSTTADGVGATNPVITRIGTLFFVRVPGAVVADGSLSGFTLPQGNIIWSNSLTQTDPILFNILFKNKGSVYVDPSGTISITNIWGAPIASVAVDPWFAMPQSLRFRQVQWVTTFLFGRYTAHVVINPGFGTSTDTADLVFWVIPWKILLLAFIGLVIIIAMLRWIVTHISFVSKK